MHLAPQPEVNAVKTQIVALKIVHPIFSMVDRSFVRGKEKLFNVLKKELL